MSGEARTRAVVAERSRGLCEVCGAARAESVHHRLPRSHGGRWSPANCLHLCGHGTAGCHGWIEQRRARSYRAGWLVRSTADPAATPARLAVLDRPVLLTDDGDLVPVDDKEVSGDRTA